jgi:3-deoxy-manno-octulosonate cytidylyltransferase (CMP-KDO synthetase)
MKVLAVIPARYGAQRFPGKPLARLAGKPMVLWVYEAARRALPDVVVATDDRRIADAVASSGGRAVLTPASCRSGTDRVAHVARTIRAGIYLNIQGDEPLMTTRTIRRVLALHRDPAVKMGTAVTALPQAGRTNPDTVKALVDRRGDALYFSRAALPYFREGTPSFGGTRFPGVFKHLGIYSYTADFLKQFVRWPRGVFEAAESLEQLRALENGAALRAAFTPDDSTGVDRPADAVRAEKLLKRGT